MKINSPKKIAFLNALIITLITSIAMLIIGYAHSVIELSIISVISAIIFIVSYLLINYSISIFLNEKIKVIYKSIGNYSLPANAKNTTNRNNDVLEIVNQVVLRWSEEKKKEIEELKEMASYRREFMGNVSHELKTPIFNIQGYVHTLLEGGINDKSINVKFLEKSVKSINRMITLVEELEEISKLESGNVQLKKEVFKIPELTQEVIDFLEHKASLNNTTISINNTLSQSLKVKADKKRIRQVLINLIDNAIKYGNNEKGIIKISFYDFNDNYLVEIKDNGIGITEENMLRVFERFYRTDQSRSRDKGGSGLGLAIVKHIIEAHQQTISVRSNVGIGTTFSFTLKKAN